MTAEGRVLSECEAVAPRLPGRDARKNICDLSVGHPGPHNDSIGMYQWDEPGRGLSANEALLNEVIALRSLLRECYYDLHPVTAGTSRSGGPGGASITTHCIVVGGAWTDAEQSLVQRIERAIHRPHEPLAGGSHV